MKKFLSILLIAVMMIGSAVSPASAESNATYDGVSGKSVVSGLCSFIIWPGIGQYINDCEKDKNITHALVGLFPPFRFWSGWDAFVNRKGGYWEGKV